MDITQQQQLSVRKIVFVAAFFVIFVCSASAAFSVFSIPLQEATGGDAAQVAFALTIYQFFMALFGIISGRIVDKSGPKKLMYVGGLVFGLGWFATAFATSIPMLYITCGFVAGAGNGLLYNPALNTALRWYPEKRGTMSGVLLCAASVGPLVTARAGAILCDAFGIQGLMYLGVAYLIVIWAVGWKMSLPEKGWQPANFTQQTAQGNPSGKSFSPKEMVSTLQFWLLLLLFSVACTAGIMMIGSLSAIGQTQLGMSAIAASNLVAVNLISNLCGRLIIGKLCDKWGELPTLALIFVLTFVALIGLSFAYSLPVFIFFLIILGWSFGGVLVVFPPLTAKTFGMEFSGVNYGIMFFGYSVGALFGPQIAARFVNASAGTAAYHTVFYVAAAVAVFGLILVALVRQILKKRG
ncbi:L-lactate MFS transporter [Enterococcus sp. LJL90]